jgi:hypothetical protein
VRADLLGEETEQREVVPLEHVARHARDDAAADVAGVWNSCVMTPGGTIGGSTLVMPDDPPGG